MRRRVAAGVGQDGMVMLLIIVGTSSLHSLVRRCRASKQVKQRIRG